MLNTKENGRYTNKRKTINMVTNMEIYKEEQKEIKKETVEQKECNELEGKQLEKVAAVLLKNKKLNNCIYSRKKIKKSRCLREINEVFILTQV